MFGCSRPSADLEVLGKIYNALGTPQDEGWGGLRAMPGFVEFQVSRCCNVAWLLTPLEAFWSGCHVLVGHGCWT